MRNRKDLRVAEGEWRATKQRPYAHPKAPKRSALNLHNALVAMGVVAALVVIWGAFW